MTISNGELANKARGLASCMSYDDPVHGGGAKHLLRECAHRLDTTHVRVHRKRDGLLMINGLGKSRYMTLRERLARWLLDGKMEIRP